MPHQITFDDMEWEEPPRGYYLSEVKQKTLWVDKETGATWALVKFPPGPADAYHIHPNANQLVHRVTGPDGGKGVGITLKGERHGGAVFKEETIILMFWDGPSDTVVVE